uniref:4-hydroxybutyrate coenzyme A transferase n=1 Tax=Ascaris suum TaxID=6253 RepID=F1KY80_ASCSU
MLLRCTRPIAITFRHLSQNAPKVLRTLTNPIGRGEAKYTSLEEAIKLVKTGDVIFPSASAATPSDLLRELCRQVDQGRIEHVQIVNTLIEGGAPWDDPKYYGKVKSNTMFITSSTRKLIQSGHGDYTPIFLSEIAKLFSSFRQHVDVAIVTISPPDEHGNCTLGLAADCTVEAVRAAKTIIGEVTPSMPRTFGDTQIHISQLDAVVKTDRPIYAQEPMEENTDENIAKIGKYIAENLVDDGATLQIGIGAIPDAACALLTHHKDLGVHTELLSDGVIDLIERNVVTNSRKTLDPGKIVTSFAYGTRKFYDYLDNNPLFLFRTAAYTNSPHIIMQHHKMTSINSCIEMDITGQIVSDSIGTKYYSGFGGQVDFVYGSAAALDGQGKAIIALSSCTGKGDSKIVPYLKHGAGVVTTRGHAQYIVTEYGIANLWGKSVRQRAYALIQIAHPKHREMLEKGAFEIMKCMPSKD